MTSNIFKGGDITHLYDDGGGLSAQRREQLSLAVSLAKAKEDENTPGLICFYQTAIDIYQDYNYWIKNSPNSPDFRKTYILGYSKKQKIDISWHRGLWFASPNNYAVSLEDVLRRIPDKNPGSIEW